VINLSPDKTQVFREVFRTLKPDGRVAVSDIVTNGTLPKAVRQNMEAWGACIAGALDVNDYVRGLDAAGFVDVRVQPKSDTDRALMQLPIGLPFSATVTARKPSNTEAARAPAADSIPVAADQINPPNSGLETLMGHLVDLEPLEDGYEVHFAGDPAELRALAQSFAQSAACCSSLRFDVVDAPDGVHVRITNRPAAQFVAASSIN
jgi:hypothetical protein